MTQLPWTPAPKQVSRLARCLEEYAAHFRSEELPATAALFFWPDFTRIPPRAMTKVYLVGKDPVIGPMTLARAREIYGPDELSFMMSTKWGEPIFSQAGISITDDMARNFRIKPEA